MPKVTNKPQTKHTANGSIKARTTRASVKTTKVEKALEAFDSYIPPKESAGGRSISKEPLWRGPEIDGCTQTLISKFLSCRERFRLLVVEGLKEKEGFNLRLEYGNMIHTCEEATAAKKDWMQPLLEYAKKLVKKYGASESATIDKWYKVCCAQYPVYLQHWSKHPDVKNRQPLFQEKPFDVPYVLPSGRKVRLRGKYDSVDLIDKKIYIQENKARGDIQPEKMMAELPFDMQTMFYLTAAEIEFAGKFPIGGCRYNVIRRPLSGGKHSIKQHEGRGADKKGAETEEQFYTRLRGLIESEPEFFFFRFKIETIPNDLIEFQARCLNPILESLCDWWKWISSDPYDPFRLKHKAMIGGVNHLHWQYPSGCYNPTAEGKTSIYDELILNNDPRGLIRTDNLYPELEPNA